MHLKGVDRRALRALGHGLKPSVTVGKEGVSPAVIEAILRAHEASELIKLRVLDTCPQDRREVASELQERSGSEVVQLLGRTILLYRRDPEEPRIELPSQRRG
jgi:RNA-binding protein